MKRIIALILTLLMLLSGCSMKETIGNGRIDPVEEVTIRLAVSAAFTALPAAAVPAYMVSSGLVTLIGSGYVSLPDNIDAVLDQEVNKLKFDQATRSVFFDFVSLVKAEVKQRLANTGITEHSRLVLIKQLVHIIRDVAKAKITPTSNTVAREVRYVDNAG